MMLRSFKCRGASLIEVLVVMVVLFVGILSVFRLFPPGLLALANSKDYTSATRFSSAEMERLKNRAFNLPDAIYAVKYYDSGTGLTLVADDSVLPDDLSQGVVPANSGIDPLYISDANRIRRIVGEHAAIPLPRGSEGGLYLLNFSPIVDPNAQGLLVVYGNSLRAEDMDMNDGTPFLRFWNYRFGVDYDNGAMALPPAPSSLPTATYPDGKIAYRVAFSYWIQDANKGWQQRYVVDKEIQVDSGAPQWIKFEDLIPTADKGQMKGVVEDSVTAAVVFKRLDMNQAFTTFWPYEVKVDAATPWRLIFNASGYSYSVPSGGGGTGRMHPLTARISYDVLDWHIMREERRVPDDGVYRVKLTLGDVKKVGEMNNDMTTYAGLASFAPYTGKDIMVMDAGNGDLIAPLTSANKPRYLLDYRTGNLQFFKYANQQNPADNFDPGGQTYRILYKSENDWAMQVQKADSNYTLTYDGAPTVSQCYVGGSNNNNDGLPTRLYFPKSDTGKQVTIREYYVTENNQLTHYANDTYVIRADDTRDNVAMPFIDITDQHPNATSWNWDAGFAVRGVSGVSTKVRVIWRKGQRNWSHFDVDGLLTRTGDSR